jgi:type I restriction enzyme, S subunit
VPQPGRWRFYRSSWTSIFKWITPTTHDLIVWRRLSRLINSGVPNDGLLNLNPEDFFGCKVPVPPVGEQAVIASALTAAKMEIALLDSKIEALSHQKLGLMQKLLTGEWRVKLDSEKEVAT